MLIDKCRYCLEEEGDLINPCNCEGSCKYIHKECLKKWLISRNSRFIIPGRNFMDQCELCGYSYNVVYDSFPDKMLLCRDIVFYIVVTTAWLLSLYIFIGWIMLQFPNSTFVVIDSYIGTIIVNGFILLQSILAFFYLATFASTGSLCVDLSRYSLPIHILLGILGVVFMVHIYTIIQVVERHRKRTLVDIYAV